MAGFQSTLPGWGATPLPPPKWRNGRYFNPRSPDGERPAERRRLAGGLLISIHAPRMGSDRAPAGLPHPCEISIHAPRMGSDVAPRAVSAVQCYFNPRSPDGERHVSSGNAGDAGEFQSTLPGWGATGWLHQSVSGRHNFNPRSPDGERPSLPADTCTCGLFQSTLPGWGATCRPSRQPGRSGHFNPRSPDGERPTPTVGCVRGVIFQSTLPGWGATAEAVEGTYTNT